MLLPSEYDANQKRKPRGRKLSCMYYLTIFAAYASVLLALRYTEKSARETHDSIKNLSFAFF